MNGTRWAGRGYLGALIVSACVLLCGAATQHQVLIVAGLALAGGATLAAAGIAVLLRVRSWHSTRNRR